MSHPGSVLRLTRLGHSCVLVSVELPDHTQRRLLLDPGNLTPPLTADIGPVDAVLVTHAHPDHIDVDQLPRLSGPAKVYGDARVQAYLAEAGLEDSEVLAPGTADVADVEVEVFASTHEPIYPGVPVPTNLAYLLAGTLLAPGDAFFVPDSAPDVLLLPVGAPWMKLADTIHYLRAVAPRIAVLVHDSGLSEAHQQLHRGLITKFAPSSTTVLAPALGEQLDLTSSSVST